MILFPKLDDISRNILCYVATNGPVTMYRVARDLHLHFSHVYRKAHKLESAEMIRRTETNRAAMYEASLSGYLYCYKLGHSRELMLARIRHHLGLNGFDTAEVESFLKIYLSMADRGAPISDLATMVVYLFEKCRGDFERCVAGDEWARASRIVAYGLIHLIRKLVGDSAIVSDRDFFVVINPKRRFAVAFCKLCGGDRYCFIDGCEQLRQRIEKKLREGLKVEGAAAWS